MKKITSLMKRNLWISGGLLALVLIVIAFISMSGGSQKYEIATAKKGDIIQKVRVTGKVTPMQKADLGFEKGGVLAQKNVKVGEMVYQGQVLASLDVREQQAALDLAIAKLSSERTKLSTSQVSYDESKRALINAIRDSYTKIDGAIRNELDTFFTAPQSNPTINVRVESQNLANEMNRKRESITYEFIEWKKKIDSVGISDVFNSQNRFYKIVFQ
jgi:multidrug efflux pump subunit AcrA (membrane-fusion protein)